MQRAMRMEDLQSFLIGLDELPVAEECLARGPPRSFCVSNEKPSGVLMEHFAYLTTRHRTKNM